MTMPAEFELAAACCRWPPGPDKVAAVRLAAVGIDWDHFEKVVIRHRIEPLAMRAIEEAELHPPADVADRLRTESDWVRRHNLLLAAECERLQRHLNRAGIDFIFLKGLALAPLAYGGIELKKGWDIDLLVAPVEVDRAGDLLASLGYRRTRPAADASPDALAAWRSGMKDEVYTHHASRVPVELHWSPVDNPRLLPGLGLASPRQHVRVLPGICLPTLTDDPLYAYLCVHGASSAWFRLKWIADLNAFLSTRSAAEIERLHQRAIALGAGRTSAVALLLIERLFCRPLPANLAGIRGDPVTGFLVRLAMASMSGRRALAEPTDSKTGTLTIHAFQALAMPGMAFLASEIRRQAFNPITAVNFGLPKGARFLYPLLLVPLWLRRRAAARAAQSPDENPS